MYLIFFLLFYISIKFAKEHQGQSRYNQGKIKGQISRCPFVLYVPFRPVPCYRGIPRASSSCPPRPRCSKSPGGRSARRRGPRCRWTLWRDPSGRREKLRSGQIDSYGIFNSLHYTVYTPSCRKWRACGRRPAKWQRSSRSACQVGCRAWPSWSAARTPCPENFARTAIMAAKSSKSKQI